MRKYELHLDALVTVIVVFVLALGFILYQRYQYSDLLQKNIDLVWENENLKVDLVLENNLFNKCKNEQNSKEEAVADKELINTAE